MLLTRATLSKAASARAQAARPSSRRPRSVAAASSSSSSGAISSSPKKNPASSSSSSSSSSSLRHLVDVALPHARARLRPFVDADAALARLIADPLLVRATTTIPSGGRVSSNGNGNGNSNGNGAQAEAEACAATRSAVEAVDTAVDVALALAFHTTADEEAAAGEAVVAGAAAAAAAAADDADAADAARLFLMRCLYAVNRLTYVWYGAPLEKTYGNERSPWLLALRDRIEVPWQAWEEAQQMGAAAAAAGADDDVSLFPPASSSSASSSSPLLARYRALTAAAAERLLLSRLERDRYRPSAPDGGGGSSAASALSTDLAALRDRLTPDGYAHLLAAGAHDGLTEASRQSRVCAGTGHPAASAVFRILADEYGNGRLDKKHSSYYAAAMRACGILGGRGEAGGVAGGEEDSAERWLDLAPWEALAATNHNFLLAERRRNILRYCGALAAFELYGPWAYEAYAAAADRAETEGGGGGRRMATAGALGGYWRLHVKEDARHGPQAVREVALPLVRLYGDASAWEVVFGYDQENFLGARATRAVRRDIERCGGLDAEAVLVE